LQHSWTSGSGSVETQPVILSLKIFWTSFSST
jgi:hypothetical protein